MQLESHSVGFYFFRLFLNPAWKSHFHNLSKIFQIRDLDLEYGFYPIRRSVIGGGWGLIRKV